MATTTSSSENAVLTATAAAGSRPAEVEPFLAGAPFPAIGDVAYPRALAADVGRLPADTWASAQLPVGVRIELVGEAEAVELDYVTATDDLGYRGAGAGTEFALYAVGENAGDPVATAAAVLGAGSVRFALPAGVVPERWSVYLPEGMRPTITAVRGIGGEVRPAPRQTRWVCYGDSIAEGWVSSGPARAWPAVVGRRLGLDAVNLGYAGAARGEMVMAEAIAGLDAGIISINHGTNCWTRISHSAEQVAVGLAAFIELVRTGHPTTPIVVLSPIVRPDAESSPNKLGATLADIRDAIETTTRDLSRTDPDLTLIEGGDLVAADALPDGIHPGDDGHAAIADAVARALATRLA